MVSASEPLAAAARGKAPAAAGPNLGVPRDWGVSTLDAGRTAGDGAECGFGGAGRAGAGGGGGDFLKIFAMVPNMCGRRLSKPRATTGLLPKKPPENAPHPRSCVEAKQVLIFAQALSPPDDTNARRFIE